MKSKYYFSPNRLDVYGATKYLHHILRSSFVFILSYILLFLLLTIGLHYCDTLYTNCLFCMHLLNYYHNVIM